MRGNSILRIVAVPLAAASVSQPLIARFIG
jgi:hypothetical protein